MRAIIGATLALSTGLVSGALAESYPTRPITIVSPFPAGSPVDTVARIVGERMKAPLSQALVIDNVTGAGGTIGVARATRARRTDISLASVISVRTWWQARSIRRNMTC